jgi:DNA polymerase-3 subunit alpha
MADFSDSSGQFSASCFEEGLVDSFQLWAAEGTCVLLNVELDSPGPDEPPRVTVRSATPLTEVTNTARMRLECAVESVEALQQLAMLMDRGENRRGEVVLTLRLQSEEQVTLRLGWDFALSGELIEMIEQIDGLTVVSFGKQRTGGHLRRAA